ncbi:putative multidrug resistance protein NorM [Dissostichus eleginoides]|uniref:Multidrug resistance protein NorM n=1 Tax=Dissostichus eleginoides TaxID=100907 RepID=A0AAD9FKG9_DISEL|nr:putative multidrug resistance protein NorM [Dissostichus eleginoides]
MSEDDKLPHMHNVTLREAQTIFFDNIRTVIFDEHELRSLQSLLRDYSSIVSRYGFPTSGVKSSYIKDILTREFKDKIGSHSRPQRNQSDLVYDTSGSVHMSKQRSPLLVSAVSNWCKMWLRGSEMMSSPSNSSHGLHESRS